MNQDPIILAIDTSCDETAAAVTMRRRILSNVIFSQVDIHQKYGGVYPALAKRAHQERIDGVVNEALKRAEIQYQKLGWGAGNTSRHEGETREKSKYEQGLTLSDSVGIADRVRPCQPPCQPTNSPNQLPLSAVAVTQGPGLAIALEVGIAKAKELSIIGWGAGNTSRHEGETREKSKYEQGLTLSDSVGIADRVRPCQPTNSPNQLPLIAVNHLEGHILSTIAQNSMGKPKREILFPALALVVSGGNTQILMVHDIGKYKLIGETLDDACGEAFDKAARILKLGYPGGPIIERLALTGDPKKYVLKPVLTAKNNLSFSYSGLKTAFLYLVNNLPEREFDGNINNLAAAFQYRAFEQITRKLTRAIELYHPKTILCGGGVIANRYLRNILHQTTSRFNLPLYFPTGKLLYGDNAAMIGVAAYHRYMRGEFIKPEGLDRKPRFPL